jgi:hypothetical protein
MFVASIGNIDINGIPTHNEWGAQWSFLSDTVHSSPVHPQKFYFNSFERQPSDSVDMLEKTLME